MKLITISELANRDNLIMKALKVGEISHTIAKTDKGDLNMKLGKGETSTDYRFTLDAVPMSKKDNEKLINLFDGMLYDIPMIEEEIVVEEIPKEVMTPVTGTETPQELPNITSSETLKDNVSGTN